jgi:hypothetical protein
LRRVFIRSRGFENVLWRGVDSAKLATSRAAKTDHHAAVSPGPCLDGPAVPAKPMSNEMEQVHPVESERPIENQPRKE